jgi:hypothetical protein
MEASAHRAGGAAEFAAAGLVEGLQVRLVDVAEGAGVMKSEGHSRRRVLRAAGLALVAAPALNLTRGNPVMLRSDGSPTIGEFGKTLTENLGVVLRAARISHFRRGRS